MFEARKGLQGEPPNSFKSASYPHCLVVGVWQVWASAFHKKFKALTAESASSFFSYPSLANHFSSLFSKYLSSAHFLLSCFACILTFNPHSPM